MQILSIEVEDGYMQSFINFVNNSHSNITILKDKNLEIDPYFYDRKDRLSKIIERMDVNPSKLNNFENFENKMDKLEKELESRYTDQT